MRALLLEAVKSVVPLFVCAAIVCVALASWSVLLATSRHVWHFSWRRPWPTFSPRQIHTCRDQLLMPQLSEFVLIDVALASRARSGSCWLCFCKARLQSSPLPPPPPLPPPHRLPPPPHLLPRLDADHHGDLRTRLLCLIQACSPPRLPPSQRLKLIFGFWCLPPALAAWCRCSSHC